MGVRRHLPAVRLAVHLRPRLSGRADRPGRAMAQGCCSYGAHFTDDDDVARVKRAAQTLTDDQWQFAATGRAAEWSAPRPTAPGSPGWSTGPASSSTAPIPGRAGLRPPSGRPRAGSAPLELKPDVCWQLPLRREDTTDDAGWVTSTDHPMGPAPLGRRRGGVSLVVHRGAAKRFTAASPSTSASAPSSSAMVGRGDLWPPGRLSPGPPRHRNTAPPSGAAHPAPRSDRPLALTPRPGSDPRPPWSGPGSGPAGVSGGRPGRSLLLLVVLHGQAPRRVIITGLCATLGAGLDDLLGRALQRTRLFEAPMPSLFHVPLPWSFGGRDMS